MSYLSACALHAALHAVLQYCHAAFTENNIAV